MHAATNKYAGMVKVVYKLGVGRVVCVCVGGGGWGGVRQGAVCVWEGGRGYVVVIGIIRQGGARSYIDFL